MSDVRSLVPPPSLSEVAALFPVIDPVARQVLQRYMGLPDPQAALNETKLLQVALFAWLQQQLGMTPLGAFHLLEIFDPDLAGFVAAQERTRAAMPPGTVPAVFQICDSDWATLRYGSWSRGFLHVLQDQWVQTLPRPPLTVHSCDLNVLGIRTQGILAQRRNLQRQEEYPHVQRSEPLGHDPAAAPGPTSQRPPAPGPTEQ